MNHHKTVSVQKECTPTPAPIPSVKTPPPIIQTPSVPLPQPQTPSTPSTGNGMIWCSGPQAPGWDVSLPNGGCSPEVKVIKLDQIPYTGESQIDVISSILLYAFIVIFATFSALHLWRNKLSPFLL